MCSDSEARIPLELFHRHLVRVHGKGEAATILDTLERKASQSGEPFRELVKEWVKCKYPEEISYQEENWYVTEVPLASCYFAHDDFRLRWVPKNERFVDFMRDKRDEIESGSFPCSSEIRAPWPGSMPEPLVREREPRKFYILDGQMRVIWHWYHNVPTVRVFIYRGKLAV
jgi:hypothetical protein